jgi:hypothetical protein
MCAKSTDYLVLETVVCDSDDKNFILKVEEDVNGYDKSLIGIGSRPSAEFIEEILKDNGYEFERVNDSRCNAGHHEYDWEVQNTGVRLFGKRRFWFCKKNRIE